MRVKLTAKHPRPASPARAPIRRTGLKHGQAQSAQPKPSQGGARKDAPSPQPPRAPRAPRAAGPGAASSASDRAARPGATTTRPTGERSERREDTRSSAKSRAAEPRAKPAGTSPGRRTDDERAARSAKPAGAGYEKRGTRSAQEGRDTPPRQAWGPKSAAPGAADKRTPADKSAGYEKRGARPPQERRDAPPRQAWSSKPAASAGAAEKRSSTKSSGARPAGPARSPQGERRSGRPPATSRGAEQTGKPAPRADVPPARKAAPRTKVDSTAAAMPAPASVGAQRALSEADRDDRPGALRLSKRMSELGLCSRREADEWIEKGWVQVDGIPITTLGSKVTPEQKIEVASAARAAQLKQATILLHKPMGYVSGQPEDNHEPAVLLVKPATQWEGDTSGVSFQHVHLRALAPAGRLDIDSTGLLVFTQDGRVAKQLIGENSEVEKEYLVRVTYGAYTEEIASHFPADKLALLCHGLALDDMPLKPAQVDWQNGEQLRFVLREGKKRQIRRMCELVGLDVVGIKRVRIGKLMLGALPVGQWRYLGTH